MGETRYIEFSDAAIRAEAKNKDVRDLRDKRYPDMRFRFLKDRRRGAWYTVHAGKWQKAADWPRCGCKELEARRSSFQLLHAGGVHPGAMLCALYTVGDVVSGVAFEHDHGIEGAQGQLPVTGQELDFSAPVGFAGGSIDDGHA